MNSFAEALKSKDLEAIRKFPKADLHNHFVLGGDRDYLERVTGRKIEPLYRPLQSMREMHAWNEANLGAKFDTPEMWCELIRAAFHQAKKDGIAVIEIGEDVWGLGKYFHNDINALTEAFVSSQREIAPNTEPRLQIGLSRHCPVDYLESCLTAEELDAIRLTGLKARK